MLILHDLKYNILIHMIIGIDEVGRGAWAGPLVVGAVLLSQPIADLTDSKLLTKRRRTELDLKIRNVAEFVGLGWVYPVEIDQVGLTAAMKLGCRRAIEGAPDLGIVIDGHINYMSDNPWSTCLIKADQTVAAVSAASIVAKVARDNYMIDLASEYPSYGFDKHVGYGTNVHIKALKDFGILAVHRISYKPVKLYGSA